MTTATTSEYLPPTCILTGAEGENPDDCTTHDHESPEAATPRPWHVSSDGVTIVKPHIQANSEFAKQQGTIVARSCYSREESADTPKGGQWTEETKANAQLIVRAVNAHDGLVAALAALVKWMDDSGHSKTKAGGKGVIRYEGHEYQVVTQAREALKLARGE